METNDEIATLLRIVKLCKETSQRGGIYYFRIELSDIVIMVHIEIYNVQKKLEVFQETARFGESPSKLEVLEKKIKELLKKVKEK